MSTESIRSHQRLLYWLSNSPELLSDRYHSVAMIKRPLNNDLGLSTGFHSDHHRLGLIFEDLIASYFKNNLNIIDIKRNIQIKDSERTLGELDFLFPLKGQYWHLEVAVKFYLKALGSNQIGDYWGPGLKDNFARKWRHLSTRQITLSDSPAARPLLDSLGIPFVRQAIWMKGWIFYHPSEAATRPPQPINPWHQRGWWVYRSELESQLKNQVAGARFLQPRRQDWLLHPADLAAPAMDLRQLISQVERKQNLAQIWVCLGEGVSRQLISRGFVVPDDWDPGRAQGEDTGE